MNLLQHVRAGTIKPPKSKRGWKYQRAALLNRYRKDYSSGGAFGFDWPTLRMNEPELYAYILQNDAFSRLLLPEVES